MTPREPREASLGRCGYCGKFIYRSRKVAKKAADRIHPGAHLRAYECHKALADGVAGRWHFGHLPDWVMRGRLTP